MNIDDLTLGQAKNLASIFGEQKTTEKHPLEGEKVVAVIPNGFIHFGTLRTIGHRYMLTEASNIRYWSKRNDGLPGFAKNGPLDGDSIDKIGSVYLESVLFFYPAGDWSA